MNNKRTIENKELVPYTFKELWVLLARVRIWGAANWQVDSFNSGSFKLNPSPGGPCEASRAMSRVFTV